MFSYYISFSADCGLYLLYAAQTQFLFFLVNLGVLVLLTKNGEQPTRTEAIKAFLVNSTEQDLAALYNYNMEVQVNVAQENGQLVESEYKGKSYRSYTDGVNKWKSFRIPRNANTTPEYDDVAMSYPLDKYAEGIGMTGWDWVDKLSRWVAFDFDAIVGHSDQHTKKLTEEQLIKLREKISTVSWTTIRHSTSGNGLHVYVFFKNPVPTNNHNEHAALGRAILGLMSSVSGCDLTTSVDACGQNMWVWHRKMLGTNGLKLIKVGEPLDEIPDHWRDHLDVITSKRKKVVPFFIKQADDSNGTLEKLFNEVTGLRPRIELDQDHIKLIQWMKDNSTSYKTWYDADNNMLVTHTLALKEAHSKLNLDGIFETISEGTDNTQNCFAYPCRYGAWVVRRYTPGVAEHPTWEVDRNGWTRCFFNRSPTLRTASTLHGGIEHSTGGYVFSSAKVACEAIKALGGDIDLHPMYETRETKIKETKDGRVVIEMAAIDQADEPAKLNGWLKEGKKWRRLIEIKSAPQNEIEIGNFDDVLRHVVTEEGEDQGWLIKGEGNTWKDEPLAHVRLFMSTFGLTPEELNQTLGMCIVKSWSLVNKPFQPEYPGDRTWNRNAVQLKYLPSQDLDNLNYPTWKKILDHIGKGLDDGVSKHPWCKANGIKTGSEYLLCWIASTVQYPQEPLPYLFLYGDQDTGKSILHEALSLLFTKGVERADRAITDPTFNGEIEKAIICVIEEIDLGGKGSKTAYNRIKDWVTSRMLSIRKLYQTAYMVTNTTHWIQCANVITYCPVFPGDTRVVVCRVNQLTEKEFVAKRDLISRLIKEAPDFTAKILKLELPECKDRLRIPVIMTSDKNELEKSNMNEVEKFIHTKCYYTPGRYVEFSEFFDRFVNSLDVTIQLDWNRLKVNKALDIKKFPIGKIDGVSCIGNISFDNVEPDGIYEINGTLLVRKE